MTIEQMKERKRELGYTNQRIADLSGLPLSTVQKIFAGITKSPSFRTITKLESVLDDLPGKAVLAYSTEAERNANSVHEPYAEYSNDVDDTLDCNSDANHQADPCSNKHGKRQGEYTIDDVFALPDEQRAELIDGVMFYMDGASIPHQITAFQLAYMFQSFIEAHHGDCITLTSDTGVRLEDNDRNYLLPDVVVVCDPNHLQKKWIQGPPDLVVEVLSPSTKRKDMTLKMGKYEKFGVKEYWMVNLETQQIVIYDFAHNGKVSLYSFHDAIPVGIWNGECVIHFETICRQISRFL